MVFLVFLGGVVFGSIVSNIFRYRKTGYGHFRIEPYYDEDNDDLYKVNITLTPNQKLLDVKKIILHKDDSQQ